MALSMSQRTILFLVGCLGSRLLLVRLAATVPATWLRVMAVFASIVALGFAAIYVGGLRSTGIETGGEKIWWNDLRPVHAALYATFAYFAWTGQRERAWQTLLVDVTLGFAAYVSHRISP